MAWAPATPQWSPSASIFSSRSDSPPRRARCRHRACPAVPPSAQTTFLSFSLLLLLHPSLLPSAFFSPSLLRAVIDPLCRAVTFWKSPALPYIQSHRAQTLHAHTAPPRRDPTGPFFFAVDHCFPIKGQVHSLSSSSLLAPTLSLSLSLARSLARSRSLFLLYVCPQLTSRDRAPS